MSEAFATVALGCRVTLSGKYRKRIKYKLCDGESSEKEGIIASFSTLFATFVWLDEVGSLSSLDIASPFNVQYAC